MPDDNTTTNEAEQADIVTRLEEQIAAALLAVNPNTTASYPDAVWTGSEELSWPITVYTVETATVDTRARAEARIRVTAYVDTFARSRAEAGATAAAVRAAMLQILPECSMDRTFDNPTAHVVRRAQTYTGILHVYDGITYSR